MSMRIAGLAVIAVAWVVVGWASAEPPPVVTPEPGWIRKQLLLPDLDLTPVAEDFERSGQYRDAAEVYGKMAELAEKEANRAYAKLRQADSLFAAGEYRQAYEAYEVVRTSYRDQVSYEHLTGMLRKLAETYASGTVGWLGGNDYQAARGIYSAVLEMAPTGPLAAADTVRLAQLQRADGLYDEAIATFEEVVRRFPNTPQADEARLELTRTSLEKAQAGRGDAKLARQAQQQATRLAEGAAGRPLAEEAAALKAAADEALVQHFLYLGEFYQRKAHYRPEAARRYLTTVLEKAAGTASADQAQALLARLPTGEALSAPVPAAERIESDRQLPPPAQAVPAAVPDTAEGAVVEPPPARTVIEEKERVKKWLLPIPDLGL